MQTEVKSEAELKPPFKIGFGVTPRNLGLPFAIWIADEQSTQSLSWKRAMSATFLIFEVYIAWNRRAS